MTAESEKRIYRPDVRADLRDVDDHGSWRDVRHAMHLEGDGGHE